MEKLSSPGVVRNIPLNKITKNQFQPINYFNEDAIIELAQAMKKHGLFSKATYIGHAKEYNIKLLLSQIEHADDKVSERQRAQEEISVIKKKAVGASLINTIEQKRSTSDKVVSSIKNSIKSTITTQSKKSVNSKNIKTVKRK